MRARAVAGSLVAAVSMAFVLGQVAFSSSQAGTTAMQDGFALSGTVTSAQEGRMEGVLVSAKRAGSTITTTVVSDREGRYRFPASRLALGQYALSIRAVGYELEGPDTAEIVSSQTATVDLKLRPAQDLAAQLTNAEWLESWPGTQEQKGSLTQCVQCHTYERVARSYHTETAWLQVLARMGAYAFMSFPLKPQYLPDAAERLRRPPSDSMRRQADYLATVNLSNAREWEYELKTLPRPRGQATEVIYTTYELPRRVIQPHDAIVDSQGFVWFNDFGGQILGKLDPRTGEVTEYRWPILREGEAVGTLSVHFDRDENLWLGNMFQEAIVRFDRRTETFRTWLIPEKYRGTARITRVAAESIHVDGKVWMVDSGNTLIHRLDVASGKFETFDPLPDKPHNIYGINADSHNNLYLHVYSHEHIGRIDAKTGKVDLWQMTIPRGAPRRGMVDSEDRLWFAAFRGNAIGMFDPRTEQIKEWVLPTVWSWPYDATVDRTGHVWAGGMHNDRVQRLNPETGEVIDYLMPIPTNTRRVFVDNATTPPTFWVGSNHGGAIVALQALDAPDLTTTVRD